MALSQDIVQQFAKTVTPKEEPKEATYNATYKSIGGKDYVQIDGSEILTPVKTTVVAEEDDRVKVMIKEHTATIIGNITSPSARSTDLNNLKDTVDEQGNTIQQMDNTIIQQGNSIIQLNNSINQQGNTINQHNTIINQHSDQIASMNNTILAHDNAIELANNSIAVQGGRIDSLNDTVTSQGNSITAMNNTIQQHGNNITQINNTVQQQGNTIIQQGNKIEQQDTTIQQMGDTILSHGNLLILYGNEISMLNSDVDINESAIRILNSGFEIVDGVLKGLSQIVIEDLETNTLNVDYAKIDFANINMASVEKLFSDSGIISDLSTEDARITGKLVGVTIHGDLIEGGTIVADKLVVLGSDGLYYKLNMMGSTVESEQTEYNSLNGKTIAAHSITASKISVSDLVAFGATIGGFQITNNSINTIGKTSISSNAPGLYMDSDGQMAIGANNNNHIKYFKNENDEYELDVRLNKLYLGSSTKTAEEQFTGMVELSAENITSSFTTSGGNNLLRNSVGYAQTDFWVKTGNVATYQLDAMSTSGSEFIFTGAASLSQSYKTQIGETYSIAFKYKHIANGTVNPVVVKLKGADQNEITILNSTTAQTEWKYLEDDTPGNEGLLYKTYTASTNSPSIEITCSGDDRFEITDLIISQGVNTIWTGYIDEVYGKMHRLDSSGLKLYNKASTESDVSNSSLTSTDLSFYEDGTETCVVSKEKVKTEVGEFSEGYKIGRLKVMLLDDNNIIEYI